jgi:hypothetical protein
VKNVPEIGGAVQNKFRCFTYTAYGVSVFKYVWGLLAFRGFVKMFGVLCLA